MKCNQCVKKDVCRNFIHNCDNACSHFLGIRGIWQAISEQMNDSAFVTDKFVDMYGEEVVFDKKINL